MHNLMYLYYLDTNECLSGAHGFTCDGFTW